MARQRRTGGSEEIDTEAQEERAKEVKMEGGGGTEEEGGKEDGGRGGGTGRRSASSNGHLDASGTSRLRSLRPTRLLTIPLASWEELTAPSRASACAGVRERQACGGSGGGA
eukprot:765672-Hanusia_phi.AAC.2